MILNGHFLPGGVPLTLDKGVNETYRGVIEVGGSRIVAYVKFAPARQLVNELFASALGQLAGVKVPRSFLVKVSLADYPASPFLQAIGTDALAFASEEVGRGTVLRRVSVSSAPALAAFFRTWKQWPDAASFDDWIANADRHPGNMLIGSAGEVWLIDHSHAFTGPVWAAADLDPSVSTKNQLCQVACGCISMTERLGAYTASLLAAGIFENVKVADAAIAAHIAHHLVAGDANSLTNFATVRPSDVPDRISAHLGLPSLKLGVPA